MNTSVTRALALGAAVGFAFAFSPGCSSSSKCGPSNCGNGCCNSSGQCVQVANENAQTCGTAGNACAACTGTQTCNSGACGAACVGSGCDGGGNCSPSNCPTGCCTSYASGGLCLVGGSLTTSHCGNGGGICQACNTGLSCTVGTTGGTCGNSTADAGGGVGDPCATNSDCVTAMGNSAAICLTQTQDGGTAFPNGYCSLICNQTTARCPGNSNCRPIGAIVNGVTGLNNGFYGETRSICLANCASDWDCNAPDYTCLGGNVIFSDGGYDPSFGVGCVPNPVAHDGETGKPCAQFSDCSFPPTNGFCEPDTLTLIDGGTEPSGFTGGYCTSDCLAALFSPSGVDPDAWCGDGGSCIIDLEIKQGTQNLPIAASCYSKCSTPNTGQGECRSGYVCLPLYFSNGTLAPTGICQPACGVAGVGCNTGYVCDAGFCR